MSICVRVKKRKRKKKISPRWLDSQPSTCEIQSNFVNKQKTKRLLIALGLTNYGTDMSCPWYSENKETYTKLIYLPRTLEHSVKILLDSWQSEHPPFQKRNLLTC